MIQTWASYIFGLLTVLVIALIIPQTHWHVLFSRPMGPWLGGFLPALSVIIAGTGLSWANAAADYSRYLPRTTRASAIIWSTTLGAGIPLVILMIVGTLLATVVPTLAITSNPIQLVREALPRWAAIPYLITAAGGLIVEADLSLYSSGLNLLNMFVPLKRYKSVAIDAIIMAVGTIYVVLVAQNFFGPFESFVTLLGVGLAAWSGIFLADQLFRRPRASDSQPEQRYAHAAATIPRVRLPALISWFVGVVVGSLFTTSPLYTGPLARGIFSGSSVELAFAFVIAGSLFLLTDRPRALQPSIVAIIEER